MNPRKLLLGGALMGLAVVVLYDALQPRRLEDRVMSLLEKMEEREEMAKSQLLQAIEDATNALAVRLEARDRDKADLLAAKDGQITRLTDVLQKLQDDDAIKDAATTERINDLLAQLQQEKDQEATTQAEIDAESANIIAHLYAIAPNTAPVVVPPGGQPIPPVVPTPAPDRTPDRSRSSR